MSYSKVKSALDEIALAIRGQSAALGKAKSNAQITSEALAALPTTYAAEIAEIQAYGTTNAAEAAAKAELAKLTDEFQSLKAIADAVAAINV